MADVHRTEDLVSRLREEYVQQSARCGEEDSQDRALLAQEAANEIDRLRSALQMIADETLCPELWRPEARKDWSEGELAHRTALVIANAALEPATKRNAT